MSEVSDQVATDVLADLMGVEVDEAPEGEQPEEAVAPEAHETADDVEAEAPVVNLDPELPEDVAEFLDEPDFDVSDDEVESVEVSDVNEETDEYEDEEVTKLKRELAKERKRREHAEKLRLQSQRGNWEKEAKKYFPLSEPAWATINASSRRGFLRAARDAHESMKPYVQQFLDQHKADTAAAREAARAKARQEAQEAWGKPLTGPGAPSSPKEAVAELEKARSTGSLVQVIKARLKTDQI